MQRRRVISIAGAAAASAALGRPACGADEAPPPFTLVVPTPAGGGTDATARVLARLLGQRLAEPVVVAGRPQRSGAAGLEAIAGAAPDGRTIGIMTTALGLLRRHGLAGQDHRSFTPLGLYNADPAALHVRADSPIHSAGELLGTLVAGEVMVSSGGPELGIWHLALAGLLRAAALPSTAVRWHGHVAAAPALAALLGGEVDLLVCSIPEAQAVGPPSAVRTLAVLAPQRLESRPDVATLIEATGLGWSVTAWRGVVGPDGLAPEVGGPLVAALEAVCQQPELRDFMAARGYRTVWLGPDGFARTMVESEAALGPIAEALRRP